MISLPTFTIIGASICALKHCPGTGRLRPGFVSHLSPGPASSLQTFVVSFQILHFREIFLIRVAPHSELKWLGLPTHITVTSPAGRVRPIALRPGRAQSFTSTGFVTLGLQPFLVLTGSRTTATLILLERVSPNVRFHYAAAVWPLLLSFPISPGECMSTEHRIISGSEARQTADRFMSRAVPFTVEQRLKKNK